MKIITKKKIKRKMHKKAIINDIDKHTTLSYSNALEYKTVSNSNLTDTGIKLWFITMTENKYKVRPLIFFKSTIYDILNTRRKICKETQSQ